MDIRLSKSEGTDVVEVKGEVDLYSAPKLKESLLSLVEKGAQWILIDLRRVSYIDSSGLAAIIEVLRKLKDQKGDIILCSPASNVRSAFRIARLDEAVSFSDDVAAGLKQIAEKKKDPPSPDVK